MIEFSSDAKRKLVEGALDELSRLEARGGNFDRWEEHHFAEAVTDMEMGTYGLAIQMMTLYAKRPADRDRSRQDAIADKSNCLPREALRQKLKALRATLA